MTSAERKITSTRITSVAFAKSTKHAISAKKLKEMYYFLANKISFDNCTAIFPHNTMRGTKAWDRGMAKQI